MIFYGEKTVVRITSCLVLCLIVLEVLSLTLAAEENEKPTRTDVIAFLEKCRENMPLTQEEEKIAWRNREKIDLVKQFGKDFTGLDLSGIEFKQEVRGVVALNADFSHCNLQDSDFNNAVLRGARFVGTNLKNANFSYAFLENADFTEAQLDSTRFSSAEMANVTFIGLNATMCEFQFIKFQGARLMGTDFSGAHFACCGDFQTANLTGANLSDTSLEYAKFCEAILKNVHLVRADLYLADFSGANLEGADFTDAYLDAALFTEAKGID